MPEKSKTKEPSKWEVFTNFMANAMKTPGDIQAEADKGKKAKQKVKDLGFLSKDKK